MEKHVTALPSPLIWSKSEMDEMFNTHSGFIPRVRFVRPFGLEQTTSNSVSGGTCHHNLIKNEFAPLKRKHAATYCDEDDNNDNNNYNEHENDETDSHREQQLRRPNNKIVKLNCLDDLKVKSDDADVDASERDLWMIVSISKKVHKWKKMAKGFGLTKREIEQIKKNNFREDECLYQSLLKWRQKSDEPLSVETILSRLNLSVQEFRSKTDDAKSNQTHELSEFALWHLSEFIWAEWKPLGRMLGLGEHQISYIEQAYGRDEDGQRECAYQCLLRAAPLTVDRVLATLVQLELKYYARKFAEIVAVTNSF